MTEYIKREDALEITKRTSGDYATAFAEIRKIPAADVVPVVRCKDCAHLFYTMCAACGFLPRKPNDFYSYGERKDGGAE